MIVVAQRGRRSATVFDSEFAENLVEMVLHRVSADPQNDRDFLVRFALAHPFRHLLLARTEVDRWPSRPSIADLFVNKQKKAARMRVAREPNDQLTRPVSERPSAPGL